ncbi:MAG: DNA mismatch repair endonuclease MutL [Nanoarchaeota archaeon]
MPETTEMTKINFLSEDVINKIAAGEVIERPASVVKELVENSLDAKATQITVEIRDSGKKLIKVADNGEGMSEEDTRRSILRHTTSKISSAEDLFSIRTLGFRGEALASIAAVSQLSITTKRKSEYTRPKYTKSEHTESEFTKFKSTKSKYTESGEDNIGGFNLAVENGEVISFGITAAQPGTIVEVHNLFFNTPARKKFLKTDAVELRHIIDVVTGYALANPQVTFKLSHERHTLLHSPAVADARSRLASIYGTSIAKELLEVKYKDENVKINGFISRPYQCRNDKSQQELIVNGRCVRNAEINRAVYEGYHTALFVGKHPLFVLNLEINPQNIDVNVHPQKQEIKIEQSEIICTAVSAAIRKVLQENNLIPSVSLPQELSGESNFDEQQLLSEKITPNWAEAKEEKNYSKSYSFDTSRQAQFMVKEENVPLLGEVSELSAREISFPHLPPMKILGQVQKTYFVAETLDGMIYIDQHAAHERVLYEKFMSQYVNKDVAVQRLLKSEILEFSPQQKVMTLEHKFILEELGFQMEPFGENAFLIKTVPLLFGKVQPKEIIFDVLELLMDGRHKLMETKEEIVTRMACRAAVMAGDSLTIAEMEKIMSELARTEMPFTCPHGRPAIIKVTVGELEKMFRRK